MYIYIYIVVVVVTSSVLAPAWPRGLQLESYWEAAQASRRYAIQPPWATKLAAWYRAPRSQGSHQLVPGEGTASAQVRDGICRCQMGPTASTTDAVLPSHRRMHSLFDQYCEDASSMQ